MRLSHKNLFYYAYYPWYDRALPRICEQLQHIDSVLSVIDIGANIGDTAALIAERINNASILCIEGNENILPFLRHNTENIKNNTIVIEPQFCVNTAINNQFTVEMQDGTAQLVKSSEAKIHADTLDNMLMKYPCFQQANMLKIDTDGFEIMVLEGAKKLLGRHPMLYFEFTPDAYRKNEQDPMELIELLVSFSYTKALFYTNFGVPVTIVELTNKDAVLELIAKIDNERIYYYDILTVSDDTYTRYALIFESELAYRKSW
jgi:FkbM family methyltransferase